MKITIISDDNKIVEDGVITKFDFSSLIDSDIHAVQWDGTKGTIEYKNNYKPPKEINKINQFNSIINAAKQARIDQKNAEDQAELNRLANRTYKEKRKSDYPVTGDQLDAIWQFLESQGLIEDSNAEAGTPEKILSDIKTIKTKYPKV